MIKVKEDMTGWIMRDHGVYDSKITVLYRSDDHIFDNGRRSAKWVCQCECGSEPFIAFGNGIRTGKTKSCGCLKDQRNKENFKKYNKYDLSGSYGIGWTLNTGEEFYFDLEDYDKIKDYCWIAGSKTRKYRRIYTHIDNSRKQIDMHTFIGFKGYDHIDRNPMNNRKSNLRMCTQQENARNRSMQSNNTSGIIGVSWNRKDKRWIARVTVNGKDKTKNFVYKEDAIKERLLMEVKYYGEFAPQRHLFEQYGISTTQN